MAWHEPEVGELKPGVTGYSLESLPKVNTRRRLSSRAPTDSPSAPGSPSAESEDGNDQWTPKTATEKQLRFYKQPDLTDQVIQESGIRRRHSRTRAKVDYSFVDIETPGGYGTRQKGAKQNATPTKVESQPPETPVEGTRRRSRRLAASPHLAQDEYLAITLESVAARSPKPPVLRFKNPGLETTPEPDARKVTLKLPEKKPKAPKKKEAPVPNAAGFVNNDFCHTCKRVGELICCEGCPQSFHLPCVEPPLDPKRMPAGSWFCRECESKKNPPQPYEKSLFSDLLDMIPKQPPSLFCLPLGIRGYFAGVSSGPDDEYVHELNEPETDYKRERYLPPTLADDDGKAILCVMCSRSELNGPMVFCYICQTPWHVDCIDPPQLSMPRHWVCSNHVLDTDLVPRPLRFPEIRDAAQKRGNKNNGDILVCTDSEDEENNINHKRLRLIDEPDSDEEDSNLRFRTYCTGEMIAGPIKPQSRVDAIKADKITYRLPEKTIKLDFIDLIKQREKQPYIETPASQLLVQLDVLAREPQPVREAVRDMLNLKLQGSAVTAAQAKLNLQTLVDIAFDDEDARQAQAVAILMKKKGKHKLMNFLES